MGRTVVLLLAAAATCALLALPAAAATPAEGTVSEERPETKWTGTVIDPAGAGYITASETGTAAEVCEVPAGCDTFTLVVGSPGAAKLTVSIKAAVAEDWVGLSVTAPGGQERLAFNESDEETLVFENPPPGEYAVRVLAAPAETAEADYSGVATLEMPPPPPPAATPAALPPPPPPPPPAGPPPPPPVQAGPRELAIHADLRTVRRAVRFGFRTRVVCRGGCATVKLRIFVSSLTARNHRLGRFRGDVMVGGAAVLRDAEGRRETKVLFKRSVRRKLVRARTLTVAVEAVATDPDGRVRSAVKRITFRR